MTKALRLLAMCTISVALATLSIASAQTYTSIDFPGATATTLNGGPNPQGTSVGSYTASGVTHGFTLTGKGVFTSFDPPLSMLTSPNWISPKGVVVGSYLDASNVSHGFTFDGSTYTTVDYPSAAGTVLTVTVIASGAVAGPYTDSGGVGHGYSLDKKRTYTTIDFPGAFFTFVGGFGIQASTLL